MNDLNLVPPGEWPRTQDTNRFNVWRSLRYLVQAYREKDDMVRLTIRDEYANGCDKIPWSVLQAIKAACGYKNFDAVEVFPPADDAVADDGCRHLWIFPKHTRLAFAWRTPGHQLSLLREQINQSRGKESEI